VSAQALQKRVANSGRVEEIAGGWRLSVPAGDARQYRLAQLDDYAALPRRHLPHNAPLEITLTARSSQRDLPGTWGFGLWNDPFGLSLGFGGAAGRLPSLPNAAWFFFASPPSHLSLRDQQPGSGQLVGAYCSPAIPSLLMLPALIGAPLLLWGSARRWLRSLAGKAIAHDLATIAIDPTVWHEYKLAWSNESVTFSVDGLQLFATALSPRPPLGLVLWLDNQFAAWRADGDLAYGLLHSPPDCWIEITNLQISHSH
jgi:hypothetical protein